MTDTTPHDAESDHTPPTWAGLFGAAPGIDLPGEESFRRSCCHWETVHDDSVPDHEGAVRLYDHFSATIELRIAEIQPQYGLVQLNAMRRACGCLVSCDVKRDEFLAAVAKVLNVTITDAPGLSCSALWSRNQGVSCCVTAPHTVHRGSDEPDAPTWDDTGCAPGTLHDGRGGR